MALKFANKVSTCKYQVCATSYDWCAASYDWCATSYDWCNCIGFREILVLTTLF